MVLKIEDKYIVQNSFLPPTTFLRLSRHLSHPKIFLSTMSLFEFDLLFIYINICVMYVCIYICVYILLMILGIDKSNYNNAIT